MRKSGDSRDLLARIGGLYNRFVRTIRNPCSARSNILAKSAGRACVERAEGPDSFAAKIGMLERLRALLTRPGV